MHAIDQTIVGKTIRQVITRPSEGKSSLILLQFDDGSCAEFVSPKRQRLHRERATSPQLAFTV